MDPADVEAMERATVAAVAAPEVAEIAGWMVPFDAGTVEMASGHEAVPHGDHVDFLVDGRLHHVHDGHCDDHGPLLAV